MYLSIAYLLITMCFTNLTQTLPTERDLSSPRSTFINTPRHITAGNTTKHTYTSKQLWAMYNQVKPTSLANLPFGSIQRIRELQLNREPASIRNKTYQHLEPQRKAKIRNLKQVPTVYKSSEEIVWTIKVSTVNARSLKHKENMISEELLNSNIDSAIITETWLKNTDEDYAWMLSSELNNYSHQIWTKNRMDRREGGIALVTQRKYKIIKPETTEYDSFEHDIWNIQIGPRVYTIVGWYHPLQGTDTKVNNANFLDQLTGLLSYVVPKHQDIIILGDFNIHINDSEDQDDQILQNTFNAFNLKQHVNIPIHNLGHTINLIITSNDYRGKLLPRSYISDHRMITLNTNIPKWKQRTEIKYVCNLTKYGNLLMNSTTCQYWIPATSRMPPISSTQKYSGP